MTFSRDHVRELVAAAIASGEAPSEDMPDFDDPDLVFGMPDETITTRVDVTPWLDRKRAAMEAHASQIHDMAMFLAMPPETLPWRWALLHPPRHPGRSSRHRHIRVRIGSAGMMAP